MSRTGYHIPSHVRAAEHTAGKNHDMKHSLDIDNQEALYMGISYAKQKQNPTPFDPSFDK